MKITKKHRGKRVKVRTNDAELNSCGWTEIVGVMGIVGAYAFHIREDGGNTHYLSNCYWRIEEVLDGKD